MNTHFFHFGDYCQLNIILHTYIKDFKQEKIKTENELVVTNIHQVVPVIEIQLGHIGVVNADQN